MTADRAELIEINLAETLPPWCEEDNGERLSNEEQWVEAVWIGSVEEPYEKVLLIHGPHKGQVVKTFATRESTYTVLRKLFERIADIEYFMQTHHSALSRTDLDIDELLAVFDKVRKAKVVVPLVRG